MLLKTGKETKTSVSENLSQSVSQSVRQSINQSGWGRTRDKSLKCLKIARTILSQNLSETIEMLSFEVALWTQSSET